MTRILFIHILLFLANMSIANPGQPVHLRCEHLETPLGIDNPHPRFTWLMEDPRAGAAQSAYAICVGTDSLAVSAGISSQGAATPGAGYSWLIHKTVSSANSAVYQGTSFEPFTRYYWTVTIWDQDGRMMPPSSVCSFETGMLRESNWRGTWISDGISVDTKPAPYFRKSIDLHKAIRSARAYIAVAGLYELSINGKKVGDHILDPMYTRFDRRTLYLTYDVTDALAAGRNAIGVLLGNGWYNHQSTAVWYFHRAPWRSRPAFCLDLRITYTDSSVETISSDETWKTATGPVIFNSIYTGEHVDSRLELPGWNTAGFDDAKWKNAFIRAAPSAHIVSQTLRPIRYTDTIAAVSMKKFSDTDYVFDLGRNIAGVSQIRVNGASGLTIRLRHGERLRADEHVDQSNIDIHYRPTDDKDPFGTDIYILNGQGPQEFMPCFNYKGFQYVEVTSSAPIDLKAADLTGYFMHSDVPVIGHIESSNPILDKIWAATNHSYLSNLFGYPTDCPQREKNGWTGDAHIASETGLYNFDGITIYEKWMADHRDEQQPNGVLPSIIPSDGWGYSWGNGPDWTSTIAIIPWNLYLFYGDSKALADTYDNIKRYVDHIDAGYPSGLTTWGLGDWVPVKSVSPVELTSSIYYFTDANILAKAAKLFNRQTDYEHYSRLAARIRNAINAKYLHADQGIYGTGLQTELSVPLYWGIVPDSLKGRVAANLSNAVAANNFHLDVGILGAKAILNALSENGYAETAYKLASQTSYPSWGWWIVNGATTLYENWKIDAGSDISLNHIMFGEIGAWLYKGLAGIRPDPEHPGFKNILLEPHFVDGLDHFRADFNSPYGPEVSSWTRDTPAAGASPGTQGATAGGSDGNIVYTVTIPANATATLILPAMADGRVSRRVYKLAAGTYTYHVK